MAKSPDTIARKTRKRAVDAIAILPGSAPKGGRKTTAKSANRSAKAKPVAAGAKSRKTPPLRRSPRKTFLVAVTVQDGDAAADLRVYAAVTRTPAEALDAVRTLLGADVTVELTGKLSGSMAKALKLKAGEVSRI